MAGSKTTYLSRMLLDHVLGMQYYFPPDTLHLALSTAAFNPAATGEAMDEVAAGDYARIDVANDMSTWSAATDASPSEKHNAITFEWPAATADWGTPLSAYLADAATGGNLLFGADIPGASPIDIGDTAKIPLTAFIFEED
jgi:hypothetical protein